MSKQKEYQRATSLYLNWFGIHVIPHFLERWATLPQSIHCQDEKTILVGLSHECLSDGIYLRTILNVFDPELDYHGVVFAEGLYKENGKPNLRKKFADRLLPILPFHKHNPRHSEIKQIAQVAQESSAAIYIQGTRNPDAPLQDTLPAITGRGKRYKPTTIYPFVSLGIQQGIFPSESTQWDNFKAVISQSALVNKLTKKSRDVHFVAGEPISSKEVHKLASTDGQLTQELERIRLHLLSELFYEAPELISKYPHLYDEEYEYRVLGMTRRNV